MGEAKQRWLSVSVPSAVTIDPATSTLARLRMPMWLRVRMPASMRSPHMLVLVLNVSVLALAATPAETEQSLLPAGKHACMLGRDTLRLQRLDVHDYLPDPRSMLAAASQPTLAARMRMPQAPAVEFCSHACCCRSAERWFVRDAFCSSCLLPT